MLEIWGGTEKAAGVRGAVFPLDGLINVIRLES
jgi:hypothetical protein